jgi:integrase
MNMRRRGSGRIYHNGDCKTWTISYYQNGRKIRESTGTANYNEARQKLNQKLGKIANGEIISVKLDRISVADLVEDLLRDYRVNGKKSAAFVESRWKLHLSPVFGHLKAMHITTQTLNVYIDQRKQEDAENGTINRELAALKRAFNLGYRSTPPKVQRVPAFPHLAENAPRKGFITDEQYTVLKQNCPKLWLRTLLAVAYSFGFRKGELIPSKGSAGLRVRQVNLFTRKVTLDPGSTKNGEAREIALTAECYELLKACIRGKSADDYVFTHANGKPVRDERTDWRKMCVASGLGRMHCSTCAVDVSHYRKTCAECKSNLAYIGLNVHDNRRSAVRNMDRSGVPRTVAMKISGHKTSTVYDRYNIVSDADLSDAARRIENGRTFDFGHDFGHDSGNQTEIQSEHKVTRIV